MVTINETARQMIGYAPGEERSHHAREFAEYLDIFTVDGRQLLPEERPIFRVLVGDSFSDYELVCRQRRSGREWIASFVGTPVRDESGAVQLAVLSARDITERKRAERELQDAARQKDAFLAMLAHELRNPLAPILSAAEVLPRLQPGSPGQASAVEIIERQARHMARIVDDLLDVSRITTGRILLRREVLDLRELAEATVGDHRPALDQRGLRLDLRLAPEPAWVDGDRTRLAQVLDNLLVNAEKFTDPGGSVAVEVALEGAGTDGVLTVRDSGIGMEPDVLTHLFEPFSQGDRTLARSPGGLGLGMALVKGLVNMHGGDVTASSAGPGGGSEFRIRLPIVEAPAQDQPSAALPATDGVGARRVLIIEDNHDVAETLASAIELLGHRVRKAPNGWRGLEIARDWLPETVMCDIGLEGELDGYSVARTLRAERGGELQLIAITGYGRDEDRRRSTAAGFDRHVTKPVSLDVLGEVLGASSD